MQKQTKKENPERFRTDGLILLEMFFKEYPQCDYDNKREKAIDAFKMICTFDDKKIVGKASGWAGGLIHYMLWVPGENLFPIESFEKVFENSIDHIHTCQSN